MTQMVRKKMLNYFRNFHHGFYAYNGKGYSVGTEATIYLDYHYNQGVYKNNEKKQSDNSRNELLATKRSDRRTTLPIHA